MKPKIIVECCTHGKRYPAFVCQHLNMDTPVGFYEPFDSDPDKIYANDELNAWCDACDEVLWEAGEWNEETEAFASIKLVCDKSFFKVKELNQHYHLDLTLSRVPRKTKRRATFAAL